jgi:hypothetical protein
VTAFERTTWGNRPLMPLDASPEEVEPTDIAQPVANRVWGYPSGLWSQLEDRNSRNFERRADPLIVEDNKH